MRKTSLYIQALFYVLAGANHFINPEFYYKLIPEYLPYPTLINWISGIIEIVFGIGLSFKVTRRLAVYGIIAMLIAFIPSHVYFIQIGGCVEEGLCVPLIIGWIRLLLIHPMLILWAWMYRKD